MNKKIEVDRSDLLKIYDALVSAEGFFMKRDEMNSEIHLGDVRFSPITSRIQAAVIRANKLLISK